MSRPRRRRLAPTARDAPVMHPHHPEIVVARPPASATVPCIAGDPESSLIHRTRERAASNRAQRPRGSAPSRARDAMHPATAVLAMAIGWLVEWPPIATIIKVNLRNAIGRSGRRARAGAGARA